MTPPSVETIEITYLTPERFERSPQIGLTITQEWRSFARWLTWPTFAADKRAAGAWCPCALAGGVVKGGTGPVSVLTADVDDCAAQSIEKNSELLSSFSGVIVPTFNATIAKPKHRIVLRLSRALAPEEFPLAWGKMRSDLDRVGVRLDTDCKNINRLYFACVARSSDAWLGAKILTGQPIDVDAMLAAARAEVTRDVPSRPRPRPAPLPTNPDRYVAAATKKARDNVLGASAGGRHGALLREAYSLSRLSLSEDQIADALLEAFVAAAGEGRRREGERAIRDAVRKRDQT